MLHHLTFPLAYAAYLMLCVQALLHLRRRGPRWLSVLLAVTASTHVALVWHHSFNWSVSSAWSGNPAAFLIFHTAMALIVIATVAPAPWSGRCLLLAWPIVTVGALGAALRREAVVGYLWPVVGASAVTMIVGTWLLTGPGPPRAAGTRSS